MEFQIDINNVNLIQHEQVESGEYNVTECQFTFSNEFDGLTKKAVFTGEDGIAYLQTIVDNKCSIPSEILTTSQVVQIGVYAYAVENEELILRYSPEPTDFFIHEGSYKEAQNSTPPTPSEIEQLQSQITTNANDIDTLEDSITLIDQQQEIQDTNIQNNAEAIGVINETIGTINQTIGEINTDIQELQTTKADKAEIPTKTSDLSNDSGFIDNTVDDLTNYTKTSNLSNVALSGSYNDLSNTPNIPANTSDLVNDSGFITKDVNNLTYYTLKTNTGSLIDLEINGTTYVVTLNLKDVDGNVISTDTIDLPLESVVVGGSYDAVNKKIVLTLENGNTVDIPVGDLIAGLQTEITSQNKLASDLVDDTNSGNKFVTTSEKQTWNGKYDKPVGGIPDTDLSSGVQASLDKADTAIQQSDLADYVKNTDYAKNNKGGVIKIQPAVYGLDKDGNGFLYTLNTDYNTYLNKTNYYAISKGTLENVITGKKLINQTQLEESQATQDTEIEALQQENAELKQDITNMAKAMYKVDGQGSDITLQNTSENKFVEFGLEGRTEQDGEPTSETAVPIKNVTGNANVKIQNKNLFVAQKIVDDSNNADVYLTQDGFIRFKTGGNRLILKPSDIKENTQYTFKLICKSGVETTNNINFVAYYTDGSHEIMSSNARTNNQEFSAIFTTSNNKTLDYIRSGYTDEKEAFIKIDGSMILEGSYTAQTIPDYVPHQEQNYPFTFAEGQRAMQGTQLLDDGIHQKRKQKIFDGTESWFAQVFSGGVYYYTKIADGSGSTALCSHFINIDSSIAYSIPVNQFAYSGNTTKNILFNNGDTENKLTDWKAWLAEQYANGTPVIVEYELAESKLENNIIPYNETQQAQYNDIEANATSYDDITYISSESDELGFNINVVAVADANKVIDNQNSEIDTIKSRLDLLEG